LTFSKRQVFSFPPLAYSYLRQRKDRLGKKRYSMFTMNNILAISEITVADLLTATPKAVRFFIDEGTGCAICSLARFCTLEDVIRAHDLDADTFLEKLAELNIQKL